MPMPVMLTSMLELTSGSNGSERSKLKQFDLCSVRVVSGLPSTMSASERSDRLDDFHGIRQTGLFLHDPSSSQCNVPVIAVRFKAMNPGLQVTLKAVSVGLAVIGKWTSPP